MCAPEHLDSICGSALFSSFRMWFCLAFWTWRVTNDLSVASGNPGLEGHPYLISVFGLCCQLFHFLPKLLFLSVVLRLLGISRFVAAIGRLD